MKGGKSTASTIALVLALAMAIVKPWEGGARKDPYLDVVGKLTVCYGHTGADVQQRKYTDAECDRLLTSDLGIANAAVRRCIRSPMNVNQEAALTSAVFNLGPTVVCSSTLGRLANAGNWPAACRELTDAKNAKGEPLGWSYAGGDFYQGLRNRRFVERALCEKEPTP